MEKETSFKLPVGFRFCPTDEELIAYYLRNKVDSIELPTDAIKETNLYDRNPEEVIDMFDSWEEKEWYFFTPRERKYPNGKRPNRKAGTGFWKATGSDKQIKDGNGTVIGLKKSLVYYEGGASNGKKTNWIMHEYRLQESTAPTLSEPGSRENMRLDNWVLSKIYKKMNNAEKAAMRAQVRSFAASAPIEAELVDQVEEENKINQEKVPFESEMQDHNSGNYMTVAINQEIVPFECERQDHNSGNYMADKINQEIVPFQSEWYDHTTGNYMTDKKTNVEIVPCEYERQDPNNGNYMIDYDSLSQSGNYMIDRDSLCQSVDDFIMAEDDQYDLEQDDSYKILMSIHMDSLEKSRKMAAVDYRSQFQNFDPCFSDGDNNNSKM